MQRLIKALRLQRLSMLLRQHERLEGRIDRVTAKIRSLRVKLGISSTSKDTQP
jgi:hypothetical protein